MEKTTMIKQLPTTTEEMKALIQLPEYKTNKGYQNPARTKYFSAVEGSLNGWKANSFPTVRTFENMVDVMGRYPYEQEYLDECYRLAVPRFYEMFPRWRDVPEYMEAFRAFCDKRYHYTYLSKMSEEYTALQLVEALPYARIYNDKYIDTIAGIDILVLVKGKYYPIHITSEFSANSKKGMNSIAYKNGDKKIHLQDVTSKSVIVYYPRNFSKHITFAYNRYHERNNVLINNIPIFKESYIKSMLVNFEKEFGDELVQHGSEEAVPFMIEERLHKTGYFNNYICHYIDGAKSPYKKEGMGI